MKKDTTTKVYTIMRILNISSAALALACFVACSNDDFYYQDEARIRIEGPENYTSGTDSLEFSFITYPADTTEITMDIDVYVMGVAADYDRTANFTVIDDLTTAASTQYSLPSSVVVEAGETQAVLPLVLKRTEDLEDSEVRLYIQVVASDDFEVGVNEQDHLIAIWSDMLTKPSNWDELEEYFGSYSDTKYRFMLNNAEGITEFSTDTMTWAELMNYKIKFQNALDEYNAEHPDDPLTDEYGVLVTFD